MDKNFMVKIIALLVTTYYSDHFLGYKLIILYFILVLSYYSWDNDGKKECINSVDGCVAMQSFKDTGFFIPNYSEDNRTSREFR